jgi:hypothetical protein
VHTSDSSTPEIAEGEKKDIGPGRPSFFLLSSFFFFFLGGEGMVSNLALMMMMKVHCSLCGVK